MISIPLRCVWQKKTWKKNREQKSGFEISKIIPLTLDFVEKILDPEGLNRVIIDKKYIYEHYRNFTINPQITEMQRGKYITSVEISPDISWEAKK